MILKLLDWEHMVLASLIDITGDTVISSESISGKGYRYSTDGLAAG